MGTDISGAGAESGSKKRDGDDTGNDAGVVGLVDALCVIRLLRGVAAVRALVGNRDDDLGCVGIPVVVQLGRRIARDVALGVSPRQTGPSRAGAPEFAVVSAILGEIDRPAVVYYLSQLPNPT